MGTTGAHLGSQDDLAVQGAQRRRAVYVLAADHLVGGLYRRGAVAHVGVGSHIVALVVVGHHPRGGVQLVAVVVGHHVLVQAVQHHTIGGQVMLAVGIGVGGRQVLEGVDALLVGVHGHETARSRLAGGIGGPQKRISIAVQLGLHLHLHRGPVHAGVLAHPPGLGVALEVGTGLGLPVGRHARALVVAEAVVAYPDTVLIVVLLHRHRLAGHARLVVVHDAVVVIVVPHLAGDGRTRHLHQAHVPVLDTFGGT